MNDEERDEYSLALATQGSLPSIRIIVTNIRAVNGNHRGAHRMWKKSRNGIAGFAGDGDWAVASGMM